MSCFFDTAAFGSYTDMQKAIAIDPDLLDSLNSEGYTALGWASSFGNLESFLALREAGADLNLFDAGSGGEPPISAALLSANSIEIIRYLLLDKVDLDIMGWMGITPRFRLEKYLTNPDIKNRHQVLLD